MITPLQLNGTTLSTLSVGHGSPLVMLHGLVFGSMATWYSRFALPLAHDRQVVLYDQRGHGDSAPVARGFDLDTQALDLLGVAAHHAPGVAVDLVGHSMGALIALHCALRTPARVRRLLLIDAPMPAAECIAPSFDHVHDADALAAYVEAYAPDAPGGRRRARLQQRLQRLFFGSTMIADVRAMQVEPELDLAQLTCPVALVYGSRSPCRPAGTRLQRALPHARLTELDAGHYLPEEVPDALLALIRDALPVEVAA